MIAYKPEINYMRRVIAIAASLIIIATGMIIYLHSEAGKYVENDYCADETSMVFFDLYPDIGLNHQSFQDDLPGTRDKGGMLVERNNNSGLDPHPNNNLYPHPGIISKPLKKGCGPGGNNGNTGPGGVNYISEPHPILFYVFFIIFYINHRTGVI